MTISRLISRADTALIAPLPFPSTKKLVLFGDSFAAQCDAGSGVQIYANLNGSFGTWLNMFTGYRVTRVPGTNNFGVGGNTTAQMLARVATVVASNPDIVVLVGGTNDMDAGGASSATTIANLRAMYAALLGCGAIVIRVGVIPKGSGNLFTANGIKRCLAVNEADRRYSEATPGFYFVDLDPIFTDLTAATWTVISNMLGPDSLHPSPIGGAAYAQAVANIVNAIVPSWRRAIMTNSDLYDATDNVYGNFLPNPMLRGTGGTVSNGVTGTAATSVTVDGASKGGATVVASVATGSDGRQNQVVTISGSKTGSAQFVDIYQFSNASISSLVAGDILEAEAEITLGSQTSISSVDVFMQVHQASVYSYVHGSISDTAQALPASGYGSSSVLIRTPRMTLTSTPADIAVFARTAFVDGSVSVAGVVSVASMSFRKVL